jgi:hypothetical protein
LLTPEASADVQRPLTAEEQVLADSARLVWAQALAEIHGHAQLLRAVGSWPNYLAPALTQTFPRFAELASIWELVRADDAISPDDATEFHFDRSTRMWILPDRMLLSMRIAADGNEDRMRRLARAFFWHEYLHEFQYLTEHTAIGIGGFANCLERLDYVADAYGTLHQLDYLIRQAATDHFTEIDIVRLLRESISEAIDAFWTFEPPAPTQNWQVRRVRRYLNWYWRREQISSADSLAVAIAQLCEPPVIELVGPPISTDTRRVFLDLARIHRPDLLELALIDERNRLQRFPTSTTLSIPGLLEAFRQHDRPGIDRFFAALVDHARQRT